MKPVEIDVVKAKINPRAYFRSPMDVVRAAGLSDADKLAILESWELDARELQTAEEENMGGGEPSQLAEVLRAIDRLKSSGTG